MNPFRICFLLSVLLSFSIGALAKDKKTEVVTIIEMEAGDVACYLTFKDAKNKHQHEMANHEICLDTTLLNQKSTISYSQAKVLAGRCEGNPECPHTETVWLVDSAELLAPKDLCQKGEVLYHGCGTTKHKVISFCTKAKFKNNLDKTPAYLVLRYGTQKKIEMEVVSKPKAPIQSKMGRYAGGNSRFMLRWKHGGKDHLFEYTYLELDRIHGMSVIHKGKRQGFEACRDHLPGSQKLTELHGFKDL